MTKLDDARRIKQLEKDLAHWMGEADKHRHQFENSERALSDAYRMLRRAGWRQETGDAGIRALLASLPQPWFWAWALLKPKWLPWYVKQRIKARLMVMRWRIQDWKQTSKLPENPE